MDDTNPSGAVHPTIFLVLWFAVGFGLERFLPLELPWASALAPVKFGLFFAGGILFAWSALELHRNDTTMEHGAATTALVTRGSTAHGEEGGSVPGERIPRAVCELSTLGSSVDMREGGTCP